MPYEINQQVYAEQAIKPSTQLDDTYEALRHARELAVGVVELANRLCGGAPTAKEAGKLESISDGLIAELASSSREASRMISGADEALQRINRTFGL